MTRRKYRGKSELAVPGQTAALQRPLRNGVPGLLSELAAGKGVYRVCIHRRFPGWLLRPYARLKLIENPKRSGQGQSRPGDRPLVQSPL